VRKINSRINKVAGFRIRSGMTDKTEGRPHRAALFFFILTDIYTILKNIYIQLEVDMKSSVKMTSIRLDTRLADEAVKNPGG